LKKLKEFVDSIFAICKDEPLFIAQVLITLMTLAVSELNSNGLVAHLIGYGVTSTILIFHSDFDISPYYENDNQFLLFSLIRSLLILPVSFILWILYLVLVIAPVYSKTYNKV